MLQRTNTITCNIGSFTQMLTSVWIWETAVASLKDCSRLGWSLSKRVVVTTLFKHSDSGDKITVEHGTFSDHSSYNIMSEQKLICSVKSPNAQYLSLLGLVPRLLSLGASLEHVARDQDQEEKTRSMREAGYARLPYDIAQEAKRRKAMGGTLLSRVPNWHGLTARRKSKTEWEL